MTPRRIFHRIATGAVAVLFTAPLFSQTVTEAKGFFSSGSSTPNLGSVTAGVFGMTMLVTGSGFVDARGTIPGPRLIWIPSSGGCPGATCEIEAFWLDSTQLQVELPGDLIGRPDAGAKIAVANYPYSTRSNQIAFPVNEILSPAQLPSGNVGSSYAEKLFNGGTAPMAFNLVSGSYPPGLQPNDAGRLAGTPSSAGTYSFNIIVRDAWATLRQAAFSVTIGGAASGVTFTPLSPPAGTVGVAYSQLLTGAGGTAPYTFSVTAGTPPAGLTLSATGTISGTPTLLGTSQFTIQVTDSKGTKGTVTLSITINPSGTGLTFSPTSLPGGVVGQPYNQSLTGSGGTLPYTFSILSGTLPAGLSLAASGLITGTPTTVGPTSFTVRMTDGLLSSVAGALSITITAPPSTVTFTPAILPDGTTAGHYSVTLRGAGGVAPYSFSVAPGQLPSGMTLTPAGLLSGLVLQPGTWPVRIDVKDATGATGFVDTTLSILDGVQISSFSLEPATELQSYQVTLTAVGGVEPYFWSLSSGRLPSGLVLNGVGLLAGTPDAEGLSTFTVMVRDASGGTATRTFQLSVASRPPVIATRDVPVATVAAPYSFTLEGGGGTGALEWTLDSGSMPPGLTLTAAGLISGVPGNAGAFPFSVRLSDATGRSTTASLNLTVKPAPLKITTESLPDTPGGIVRLVFRATGGTTPYTWTLTGGRLPNGLSLTPGGILGGQTFDLGKFDFSLSLKDADGVTAEHSYSLVLTPAPLDLLTDALPGGVVGVAYTIKLSGEGGQQPYLWTAKGLPNGLSLDSASGDITGAPTLHGTSQVTVELIDAAGASKSRTIPLAVVPAPLLFETRTLAPASLRVAYTSALVVSGGVKPYTWQVNGQGLPPGLVLFQDGVIRGTPTSSGTATFTVTATDARDLRVSRDLSLQVVGGQVTITSSAVPDGRIGRKYSHTVAAGGGTPPYRWSGDLPEGLSLDSAGSIGGVPSQLGLAEVRVIATDAAGESAFASYPVRFALPDLPAVTIVGPPEVADPLAQSEVLIRLEEPFPVPVSGTLHVLFRGDSGVDDSTVQFSTGGRSAAFTIPANTTQAVFRVPALGLQMGTLAGEVELTATFDATDTGLPSTETPARPIRITPGPPSIAAIRAVRTEAGLDVEVSGNSSIRDLSKARFRFAFPGSAAEAIEIDVPLDELAREWFSTDRSRQTGGQFTFLRSFGLTGVSSVTVTLSDRQGVSHASSVPVR